MNSSKINQKNIHVKKNSKLMRKIEFFKCQGYFDEKKKTHTHTIFYWAVFYNITDHRSHSITMATPVKSDNPAVLCTSTKEDLLKGDVLKVWDNCPICCDDYDILCRVACHPSTTTGKSSSDMIILSSSC